MEQIDFVEAQAAANGLARLDALEVLNKRAHTLATLLLGGAGAMGTYGLGQWAKEGGTDVAVPLLSASVWCFAVAAWTVLRCLQTRPIYPLHNEPSVIQQMFIEARSDKHLIGDAAILVDVRWREVLRVEGAIRSIDAAEVSAARSLDWAYRGAVLSPVIAALSWCVWAYWR